MRRRVTKTYKMIRGFALATLLAAAGPRAAQAQILEGLAAGALVGGLLGAALYVWKPPADEPPALSLEEGEVPDVASSRVAASADPDPEEPVRADPGE